MRIRNSKIMCEYEVEVSKHKVKECSVLASYAFEEAPKGTVRPLRQMVHLCTRHHNADKRGELNWISPSKTSGMYTIEEDPEGQAIYVPTNETKIEDAYRDINAYIKENIEQYKQNLELIQENAELKRQIEALQSAYQGAMINLQKAHRSG